MNCHKRERFLKEGPFKATTSGQGKWIVVGPASDLPNYYSSFPDLFFPDKETAITAALCCCLTFEAGQQAKRWENQRVLGL